MKKIFIAAAAGAICALFSGCGIIKHFVGAAAEKNYSVGTFEYNAGDIDAVEIDWVSGSVKIGESDSARLTVSETDGGLSEAQKMRCSIENRTLIIKFCKPGCSGIFLPGTKQLTVEIPKGIMLTAKSSSAEITLEAESLAKAELQSTSGDIEAGDFSAESIYINSTSGEITVGKAYSEEGIELCTTSGGISAEILSAKEKIYAESTSGSLKFDFAEAAKEIHAESTSGTVKIERAAAPELYIKTTSGGIYSGISSCDAAKINSGSGSVKIELLDGMGAAVVPKTGSGRFDHGDCYLSDEKYIFGDGACRIDAKTGSGNIKIIQ